MNIVQSPIIRWTDGPNSCLLVRHREMASEGDKNEGQQNITPNDETQETIKQNENNTEKEKEKEEKEKGNSEKVQIIYPCIICNDHIEFDKISGIFCERGCRKWVHAKCTPMKGTSTMTAYQKSRYKCPKCVDKEREDKHKQPKENEKGPKKLGRPRKNSCFDGLMRATKTTKRSLTSPKKDAEPPNKKDKGESENRDPNDIKKMNEDEKRGKEDNGDNINKNIDNNKKLFGQKNTSGITFTDEDIKSLEEGGYIIDNPIQYVVEICKDKYEAEMKEKKIDAIIPSVSHLIQKAETYEENMITKDNLKIREKQWVIFIVNNRDEEDKEEGLGLHWSVLVYSKMDHKFLHYDTIQGTNRKVAQNLAMRIVDRTYYKDGKLPEFKEAKCIQQKNNVDCGAYAILHTMKLLEHMVGGEMHENMEMEFPPNATKEVRKELRNKITKIKQKEIGSTKTKENHDEQLDTKKLVEEVAKEVIEQMKQKEEPSEKNINISNNNNNNGRDAKNTKMHNIQKKDNNKLKHERCTYYMRGICRYGEECWRKHPRTCKKWMETGRCEKDKACTEAHPASCKLLNTIKGCTRKDCKNFHPPRRENQKPRVQRGSMEGNFRLPQRKGTYRRRYQTPMKAYRKGFPNPPRAQMGIYSSNTEKRLWLNILERIRLEVEEGNHVNFYA